MTLPVGKIKNPSTDDPLTLIPRTPFSLFSLIVAKQYSQTQIGSLSVVTLTKRLDY